MISLKDFFGFVAAVVLPAVPVLATVEAVALDNVSDARGRHRALLP
jgi:hypothetical protein